MSLVPRPRRSRRLHALATPVVVSLLLASLLGGARADNVNNDVSAEAGTDTIAAGGAITIGYKITATGTAHAAEDGQPGCNAADGTPATLQVHAPAAVTASPSALTFTSCGAFQPVVFSSSTPGEHLVTVSVSDAGPGEYRVHTATWTLRVTGAAGPLDADPPVWSVPSAIEAEATGPGGAVVVYEASASDPSGIASSSCAPASGSTFPLGTTLVACAATDGAGNVGTASFPVTVVDTTPPALGLPGDLAVTATSAGGAFVSYEATAWDLVDGPVAPACSHASGGLFAPGATLVSCTATDARGNAASGSFAVAVAFAWSGFLQPVHPGGPSAFKAGSTVPVKFALAGESAGIADLAARLHVTLPGGAEVPAGSGSAATAGNLFRYDPASGQYVFNWATKGLGPGAYVLRADLGDGVLRTALVALR